MGNGPARPGTAQAQGKHGPTRHGTAGPSMPLWAIVPGRRPRHGLSGRFSGRAGLSGPRRTSVPGWPMAHQRGEGRQQGIGKEAVAWPSRSPPWLLRVRGGRSMRVGSFHGRRGHPLHRCESEQARKAKSLRWQAHPWHQIWCRRIGAVGEGGGAWP